MLSVSVVVPILALASGAANQAKFLVDVRQVPSDVRFYRNASAADASWIRDHPRSAMARVIGRRIANRPQGIWLTGGDPGQVRGQVREITTAAAHRRRVPVLVLFNVPQRDCGRASAGGAPSTSAYEAWVRGVASGLGTRHAWLILEPDGLAGLDCLPPGQRRARVAGLRSAARTLHQHDPQARLYYDAGNSRWHDPATMAERLLAAGLPRFGDGISLNVANYDGTEDEVAYGVRVLQTVGDARLRMVVDTGRNGGPSTSRWCDPPARLGSAPTADTHDPWVDAYLWIKPPGEADGCRGWAGEFLPDRAYRLTLPVRGVEARAPSGALWPSSLWRGVRHRSGSREGAAAPGGTAPEGSRPRADTTPFAGG